MPVIAQWIIPMRTQSEANKNEHWTEKAKRHKQQKERINVQFKIHNKRIELPVTVVLTRIAPRSLDELENLPMSFKYIVDAIADNLIPGLAAGRADSDKRITWFIRQRKGKPKEYAIAIEIFHVLPEENAKKTLDDKYDELLGL